VAPPEIHVEVESLNDRDLRVTLTLRSPDQIVTDLHSLPWGGRYNGFIIVAVPPLSGGEALPGQAAFEEPMESPPVRIDRGKPLTGVVHLDSRIQGLEAALRRTDLLLFWSFEVQVQELGSSNRVGGWLLLPRRRTTP
jgi:hypothetical protein